MIKPVLIRAYELINQLVIPKGISKEQSAGDTIKPSMVILASGDGMVGLFFLG